jgi:Fic family protein
MNDTILNKRQQTVLSLLKEGGKWTRAQILKRLKKEGTQVSVVTVARDVKYLVEKKLIKTTGKARATVYFVAPINPLLEYVSLDPYFDNEAGGRNAKRKFEPRVIKQLYDLLDKEERAEFEKGAAFFKERTKNTTSTAYKKELERFVIEFSWKSSKIEGNTYDLLETETLIKEHIEAKGHSKEEAQMILNHKTAFDTILQMRARLKKLTLSNVTQLHNVMVAGLEVTTGIRVREVKITGTAYTPLVGREVLDTNLRAIIDQINRTKHPAEKALVAACMVPYLQAFMDGNKRTGRMLANAILLAHDYFPLSYRSVDVNEYKKAMILFYEQNNLYHFKRIFIEQFRFAVSNYFL